VYIEFQEFLSMNWWRHWLSQNLNVWKLQKFLLRNVTIFRLVEIPPAHGLQSHTYIYPYVYYHKNNWHWHTTLYHIDMWVTTSTLDGSILYNHIGTLIPLTCIPYIGLYLHLLNTRTIGACLFHCSRTIEC